MISPAYLGSPMIQCDCGTCTTILDPDTELLLEIEDDGSVSVLLHDRRVTFQNLETACIVLDLSYADALTATLCRGSCLD